MQISDDTQKVIDFLIQYSNGTLRKTNDVATILEISAIYDYADEINELTFCCKSLWQMHKTLKNHYYNSEETANLKIEIEKTHLQIINLLKILINNADEDDRIRFENNYFSQSSGSFLNIIDLAHDFAILKNIQIDVQQKK